MKKTILIITMLGVFLSSCTKEDEKISSEFCYSNTNTQTILHDEINREYVLYVPNSYDGSTTVPLMLNFHGFGGSASDFMRNADMRSLAESNNFILVYPQGSCLNGFSHWWRSCLV